MVAGRRLPLLLAVVLLMGMLLVVAVLPMPRENLFWRSLFDLTHVPVYGAFALVARLLFDWARGGRRWLHDGLALCLTGCVGLATEAAQFVVGRDAAIMDLLRDLLGAAAFLLAARAVLPDRPLHAAATRLVLGLLALVFVAVAVLSPVQGLLAYRQRDASFPVLCDFESPWVYRFMATRNVDVEIVDPPDAWTAADRSEVARLRYRTTAYPAFILREPHHDWTGHDTLVLELFNPQESGFPLTVRIDDARHNGSYTDRYGGTVDVGPGPSTIEIPLAEVRDSPQGREMDMSRIRSFTLFAAHPEEERLVYLSSIRLR